MNYDRCITSDMPYCPLCKYGSIEYSDADEEYAIVTGNMPSDCEWVCNAPKNKKHVKDSTELSGGHLW